LKETRIAGGISGAKFATKLNWQQSRVSKLETGLQIATREDVMAWADALDLDTAVRDELVELAKLAASEYESWLAAYHTKGGGAKAQEAIGSLDEVTVVTRHLALGMIPGLLQNEDYARAVVNTPGGPAAWTADASERERIVAARLARQKVLRDRDRQFHYVLAETALWNRFGSVVTQQAQLLHLANLAAELPSVHVRVVPFDATWPAFPLATFRIRDESMVSLEQQVGEHVIVDPRQIKDYIDQFELFAGAALKEKASIKLIQDVAARLG